MSDAPSLPAPAADAGEDDLVPLSALQHQLYCPRQCALIHVERAWAESVATVEGKLLHERTDRPGVEGRRGVRVVRAMPIRSLALGVAGVADAVEVWREGGGRDGSWRAYPVEYKRGRPKAHRADEVQLCAQGMCLEEMLGTPVPEGALFYGERRRRTVVPLDDGLRELTRRVAAETRAMISAGTTPAAGYEPKRCDACSLIEICRPRRLAGCRGKGGGSVARWLAARIGDDAAAAAEPAA